MKMLKIGTKAQADKLVVESLFKPVNGHTLDVRKYDCGKYDPSKSYIGRDVEVSDDVYALYVNKGRDSYGPYATVMCVVSAN